MYRTIITLKPEMTQEVLKEIKQIIESAFKNRAGELRNISDDLCHFIFEATEEEYGALELGALSLEENDFFLSYVLSWQWIDEEDEEESFDVLEAVERHKEFKRLYKRA